MYLASSGHCEHAHLCMFVHNVLRFSTRVHVNGDEDKAKTKYMSIAIILLLKLVHSVMISSIHSLIHSSI